MVGSNQLTLLHEGVRNFMDGVQHHQETKRKSQVSVFWKYDWSIKTVKLFINAHPTITF